MQNILSPLVVRATLLASTITICLLSCGGSSVRGTGNDRASDPPPGNGANHAMPRCVLDSLASLFRSQFCVAGNTQCGALSSETFDVSLTEFVNMVNKLSVQEPNMRGVWIQYGLDGTNGFVAGFRVVEMVPDGNDGYDYDSTGTTFFTRGVDDKLTPASYAAWERGQLAAYLDRMRVRRTIGAQPTTLDPAKFNDRTSYLIPWETVMEAMMVHCADSVQSRTRMVLACIGEQRMVEGDKANDFRHHIAASPPPGRNILLDGVDHTNFPFQFKAADYGSPCPPLGCAKFTLANEPARKCH